MSTDLPVSPTAPLYDEARRQAEICNACRYCEGYCAVFPAIMRRRDFLTGDVAQLANLCHDCRGCYYACQYADPHEFQINLPRIFAEIRRDTWRRHAWPQGFARLFDRAGVAVAALLVLAVSFLWMLAQQFKPAGGEGFYAHMSHGLMVAIFTPAFLFPLAAVAVSVRGYWREAGGGRVSLKSLCAAFAAAGRMKNLSGGRGQGCNFENTDVYSHKRRWLHHAALYGFLLCFASTSAATILHYVFSMPAPYGFFSLPKLLGVPGGILLCIGAGGLAVLKIQADPQPGFVAAWGGEMAFVLLLFFVSATGLALYAATGTAWVGGLLAVHLGAVLAFFLLMPYSKMAHGFYRLAALARDAGEISRRP